MKLSSKIFMLSGTSLTLGIALTSCDSGPPSDADNIPREALTRGYDLEALAANPTGTATLPININSGDTIEFVDLTTTIPNDFPLQRFVGESSGVLRQENSGNVEINESTFRWIWENNDFESFPIDLDGDGLVDSFSSVSMSPSPFFFPTSESTGSNFNSILAQFENRGQEISELGETLGTAGSDISSGLITNSVRTAVNALGAMVVESKWVTTLNDEFIQFDDDDFFDFDFDPGFDFLIPDMVWIPTFSSISFTVTSTNAELLTPPHTISGTYFQDYTWSQMIIDDFDTHSFHSESGVANGNGVSLNHIHPNPNSTVFFFFDELRIGTFTMTLADLEVTDGFQDIPADVE